MAKSDEKRGREEQKQAPPPALAKEAEKPAPAAVPQRRAALCLESCMVCLGPGTTTIFGGDFIVDQGHVALIAHDPHFKVFEGSPAEIEKVIADHAKAVEKLKLEGAALGMAVSRHGELVPKRR